MTSTIRKRFFVLLLIVACCSLQACGEWTSNSAGGRSDGRGPDRIILTFADDSATTQAVTWRSVDNGESAYAEIAPANSSPHLSAISTLREAATENLRTDSGAARYHSMLFDGLDPETNYSYRVSDGQLWSPWHQFRTASAAAEPFRFVYLGDAQNGVLSHWSRTIRAAIHKEPSARFIIHAGDLVDHADVDQEWDEWFTGAGYIFASVPSLPVTGNHEYVRARGQEDTTLRLSDHWQPQFTLPRETELPEDLWETVYTVDYQGLRVIVLNTTVQLERQLGWLEQQLADPSPRWRVIAIHHPLIPSRNVVDYSEVRSSLKPLVDRYRVDLVLQGHDHNYARGHIVDSASDDERAVSTVLVTSVAGAKMYGVRAERWENYADIGAVLTRTAENTQTFQVIEVDGNRLSYWAYTVTGELYDGFVLAKSENGEKTLNNHIVTEESELSCINTLPYTPEFELTIWPDRRPTGFMACAAVGAEEVTQ